MVVLLLGYTSACVSCVKALRTTYEPFVSAVSQPGISPLLPDCLRGTSLFFSFHAMLKNGL